MRPSCKSRKNATFQEGFAELSGISAVLNNSAKIDMHRGISVMKGKMSKIDICQHHGLELRNTAGIRRNVLSK